MARYRVLVGAAAAVALSSWGFAVPGTTAAVPAVTDAGVSLAVDVGADRHPISDDVYGINATSPALLAELAIPVTRWGGNATSRYNYTTGVTNSGSDWFFENDHAAGSVDDFVAAATSAGSRALVSVPTIGSIADPAKELACGFPSPPYPTQKQMAPDRVQCGNGLDTLGNPLPVALPPSQTSITEPTTYPHDLTAHLVQQHGTAAAGGVAIYELDNEPSLWSSTHRDVHPSPLNYDELAEKSIAAAAGIKQADPGAAVLGPSDWGYCGWLYSADDGDCVSGADRAAHGGLPLAQWFAKTFQEYADAHGGTRLLDYLDEHYYPQATGVALAPAGDAATQALRLRSTRSLWDPTYQDESWIGSGGGGAPPLQFIPTLRQWASAYPGTKTAITEYNWGAQDSVNGALAQADVLGIFGREGLDLATYWPGAGDLSTQPVGFAFRVFRNYDGAGHRFGDIGVRATSSDQGTLAVYGAQRSADGVVTVVVINKSTSAVTAPLTVTGATLTGTAGVVTYSGADPTHLVPSSAAVSGGTVNRTWPASSITLLTLTPAAVPPATGPQALHVSLRHGKVKILGGRHRTVLTARLTPLADGVPVLVQRLRHRRWVTVQTRTAAQGVVRTKVTYRAPYPSRWRVVVPATGQWSGATSGVVRSG